MAQLAVSSPQGTMIIPGAYPSVQTNVNSTVGIAVNGNLLIIGEADGGPSYAAQALSSMAFTPDQSAQIKSMFVSGPIVDAFNLLADPSADTDIQGAPNTIFIAKTNNSSKAFSIVDTNYGTLSDSNFGKPGNNYRYQVTNTAVEMAPTLTSNVIAAFGAALNGMSFSVRLNGGAATVITLSGTAANHDNATDLATELNGQLPAGLAASAGTLSGTIVLTVAADAAANRKSWGKSFELIDSTPGDLAALGLAQGLVVSSQEPAVEMQISNSVSGVNQIQTAAASVAMTIGYQGTSCLLTINQVTNTLTSVVTGGSGANLSVDLTQYKTLTDLAIYLNAQTGYSATVLSGGQQLAPSDLDAQTALPIASSEVGVQPGRLKIALSNFEAALAKMVLNFAPTATGGLPSAMANSIYLAGGTRGGTAPVDIVNALALAAGVNVNMIIPLFSQDSSLDIAAGVTDSSSTYTIDAIHAAVKNHVIAMSTPQVKRHRVGLLSYLGTFAAAQAKAQAMGNYRITMSCQQASQINAFGVSTVFQPWVVSVIAAGMQAAGFYKGIVNHAANLISYIDPVGYDSGNIGNQEAALESGMLVLAKDATRNYFLSDQTTYGFDNNSIYNSLQAVTLSDNIALDLNNSLFVAYVGKSFSDINEPVVEAFIAQKMAQYKAQKAIVGTTNTPLGYRNVNVQLAAPSIYVSVEIIMASCVYFVPISLTLDLVGNPAND